VSERPASPSPPQCHDRDAPPPSAAVRAPDRVPSAPTPAPVSVIDYEFPLNERTRTLLRLEDLYDKLTWFASKDHPLEHHTALVTLFEIVEVASRADLKSDLLQELERQKHSLEALRNNPQVLSEALDAVLAEIDHAASRLYGLTGKVGQELRDNEWLMSIRQRSNIPGGVCEFDLPSYHYWQHRPAAARRADLDQWIAPFLPLRDSLAIVLRILRDSGKSAQRLAEGGVFQQMLAGRAVQLVRVRVGADIAGVPEVSANRYMLNIRFVQQEGPTGRSRGVETDVPFDLTFCNL
jgi:cell division protein ZapD